MTSMSREEAIQALRNRLILSMPADQIMERIHTLRDVYIYRSPLKQITGSDANVAYVAGLIREAIQSRKRFRTLDCLKVLRNLVKNTEIENPLCPGTIKELFNIYKHFIFHRNEDVQWCASVILKDQPLDDNAVEWLLANYKRSKHLVNRLLLYPVHSIKIQRWAKRVYIKKALPDRQSEVLAWLIEDDFPEFVTDEDSNVLVWAVAKSKITHEKKVELINRYSDLRCVEAVIEIADRMESKEILEHLLGKIEIDDAS